MCRSSISLVCFILVWSCAAATASSVVLGPEFESESFRQQVFENGEVPEGLLSVTFPADESLRSQLREDLLHLRETSDPGKWACSWCSTGSWKTEGYGLHQSKQFPSFRKLKEVINLLLSEKLQRPDQKVTMMFGKIDGSQSRGEPHVHSAELTGIFYIDAGDSSENNGALLVYPPDWKKEGKYKGTGKTLRTVPQNGMLLVWPAPLFHQMPSYTSDRPRISIVFFISSQREGGVAKSKGTKKVGGNGSAVGGQESKTTEPSNLPDTAGEREKEKFDVEEL
uniref:Prolyl 4-hydroxylase alpha subunit Fe(2+) 2OG dioxygenase domain-containing protein n=1 Tax=Chromera velia CCMP2878 TaxID=1169474 RepID=A0A0G4FDV0_9ALVE|mmetsp:Transcript_7858/g.15318  ORF Transcript_7858/g.15318 Transcript_7858/m.15318 type:complete len:281 (+) Transcript_7858:231-1073(+)|eukprot:Cvel_16399.t1-p1 / transcript=Cvel_16399.t1 / gene=Cvel_16399 / organism=Chromera_velia_CCMP2878 / gene_product=hypothetical protein / transcript_product=hypothetical protein / location=Cvel_scaffold1262:29260-30099(+) / protein_length=280 / sequence_SO=supercontig / SO=protein_coding / is_pseudo=false